MLVSISYLCNLLGANYGIEEKAKEIAFRISNSLIPKFALPVNAVTMDPIYNVDIRRKRG